MKAYFRLLEFLRPHGWVFGAAVVFMVVSTLFSGIQLGMIVPLVDNVFTGKSISFANPNLPAVVKGAIERINLITPLQLLSIMIVLLPLLFLLKGVADFSKNYLMSDVSHRVVRDIRDRLYQRIQSLSLDFYSRQRAGELVSRITNDVGVVQGSISANITDLIYQSLQIVLFLTIVFLIHWRLAIVSLVLLPLILLPVLRITGRLRRISARTQEKMADISSSLFEIISGIRVVKAFSMEDYEVGRFRAQTQALYRLVMKSVKRIAALAPLTEFVGTVAAAFVLYYGGRQVINGVLSFGVFGLFLGALLSLMKPFKRLSQVQGSIQLAAAAASRIFNILDERPTIIEKKGAHSLAPIERGISFDNVWFSYNQGQAILKEINLEVKVGEIVALVGLSGVGKTTLVNLLPRFYDPSKGRVLIDGRDIREATLRSLREQIGMVTQETILFNDTIRANIAYGRRATRDDEIVEAAQAANAHQFIVGMENGYDTLIGDRGVKLSGGERQRLAIARAILKNPPILILDEATSQMDTESERLVQEAIEHLMKGRTVFVIAHRLSTIMGATKIVVLDGGRIADVGRHDELISRSGLYKRLYDMQFRSV